MKYKFKLINCINEAAGVAIIHELVFPNYNLSSLGQSLIAKFYEMHCKNKDSFLYAAYDGDEVVAFILFSCNPDRLKKEFLLINSVRILSMVKMSLFISLLKSIRDFLKRETDRLKSVETPLSVFSSRKKPHIRLLSIGALPRVQGSSCTSGLFDYTIVDLQKRGYQSTGLSVFKNNKRAIGFYKKKSFSVEKENNGLVYFSRSI